MKEKLMIVIVFCSITFLIASCNKSPEKTFVNSNESNLVSSSSNQNKNAKHAKKL